MATIPASLFVSLLKFLPNGFLKKYKFIIGSFVVAIILFSLAFEPHTQAFKLYLYIFAVAILVIGLSIQLITYYKNRYTDIKNTFVSDRQLSIDNHDESDKIFKILRRYLTKDTFQYLSKYNSNEKVIEIYSKSELEKDKQKVFVEHNIDSIKIAKIDFIFKELSGNTDKINKDFEEKTIHTEGRTLRLIFDIKRGGAYIIGDCSIDSWMDSERNIRYDIKDKKVLVFGYTTKQKNVNKCATIIGYIIDEIRATKLYGDDNSSPIINIQ